VLESTTYPGTTEELLAPILERGSGLERGQYALGYSPERIDPGNAKYNLVNTPKVTSGIDAGSLAAVDGFFAALVDRTVPVGSAAEAELVKLLALDGVGKGGGARGEEAEATAALTATEAGVIDRPKATDKGAARKIAFPNERGGLAVEVEAIEEARRRAAIGEVVYRAGTGRKREAAGLTVCFGVRFDREKEA
jgi:hypothetical protein